MGNGKKYEMEKEFVDVVGNHQEPAVMIIGGGHSVLDLPARLEALEVSTLVMEKNPRIGDSWRNRYDSLCLHMSTR
jgi:cation diffusion facilitator CzcD-associated flavoprotein CzcO